MSTPNPNQEANSVGHTPGPWYCDHAGEGRHGKFVVTEWFVGLDGHDVSIAAEIIDPHTCAPSEANARLIAAAPELLEALESILQSATPSPSEHPSMFAAWGKASAIIAKAKGVAR